MSLEWPPFLPLLVGALLLPLIPRRIRAGAFLLFPLIALAVVWHLPDGTVFTASLYHHELVLCRVDALSRVFGLVFCFISFAGGVYAFHIREDGQRVAAGLYAAGALGVTFAGDFFTLLLFWELMAVASAYLIWARRTGESSAAGFRYLVVHLFGGSLVLAGIALHLHGTGSLEMAAFAPGESVAAWMILAGVAINAAIPPLHAWLTDGYPQSTVTGAIFLSALTTKSAVYVLARIFPGWDLLIVAGVVMALYGVVYAVLANDIRQILAYHIISQVGYMVAGVGIGTELALNGTAAHAFSHILYKALLFMGAGAVLEATGRSKLTELGGLAPHMPWVVALYMVGAFSISGFPLFNGFISKSIIITAAGESHHYVTKFLLILASIGTFLHTGLKLPYWTWFGNTRSPAPARSIPPNMLLAMGLVAAGCVLFGVFPSLLYGWLPHAMDYQPYKIPHLVETTQLLVFTFVAFWILRAKVAGEPCIALDTDWFYRRPVPLLRFVFVHSVNRLFEETQRVVDCWVVRVASVARNPAAWLTRSDRSGDEFEPDRHRPPLGAGIALTLLMVFVIALMTLLG